MPAEGQLNKRKIQFLKSNIAGECGILAKLFLSKGEGLVPYSEVRRMNWTLNEKVVRFLFIFLDV